MHPGGSGRGLGASQTLQKFVFLQYILIHLEQLLLSSMITGVPSLLVAFAGLQFSTLVVLELQMLIFHLKEAFSTPPTPLQSTWLVSAQLKLSSSLPWLSFDSPS